MKKYLLKLADLLDLDGAVIYGLAVNLVQLISAPITIILISKFITAEVQGYYYTFISLTALQSFIELGFTVVILNISSHEWASLSLNKDKIIIGNADSISRLGSLTRLIAKWYSIAALLYVAIIGLIGHLLFSSKVNAGIDWILPWWIFIGISGMVFWFLPYHSMLEGCDQVKNIQKFRFSEQIIKNITLWLFIIMGSGLWAPIAAVIAALLRDLYLFLVEYKLFFETLLKQRITKLINWKKEILPMQWRLAVGGLFSYLLFSAFTPIMFHYHGAEIAGKMGMTLSIVFAIQAIGSKWLVPKMPKFGMLISKKEYNKLDQLWFRTLKIIVLIIAFSALLFWVIFNLLFYYDISLTNRLLSKTPTGLFLLGAVFMNVSYCFSAYFRAHKKEPIMILNIVTSILMGLLVWLFGAQYGPIGAASVYMFVVGAITLPWQSIIWIRFRKAWH